MRNNEPNLAPIPTIVRHLAIFHRTFRAIEGYRQRGDKDGMLLGGYLTNALHNIPAMLWNCTADTWHTPDRLEEDLSFFVEDLRERNAPEHLARTSEEILSADGAAAELGLRDDLADLDLAPYPKMYAYLDILYNSCLSMRFMRRYGYRPRRAETVDATMDFVEYDPVNHWQGIEQSWSDEAQAQGDFNGQLAQALLPVPVALVSWERFDETTFHEERIDFAIGNRIREHITLLSREQRQ